jgi:hypothetical protein
MMTPTEYAGWTADIIDLELDFGTHPDVIAFNTMHTIDTLVRSARAAGRHETAARLIAAVTTVRDAR